jgi:hypothetical protein
LTMTFYHKKQLKMHAKQSEISIDDNISSLNRKISINMLRSSKFSKVR